jgi:DNA repair protein RadD
MQLRRHQHAALLAIRASLNAGHNPAAQLATGTGKSLIIADLASDADFTIWVLTHSQELVKQNAETYYKYTGHTPGIVCSGLNRADYRHPVIFGTIQSVINPALRGEMTKPNLIIIDEAHRVSHKTGEQGMYGRIFERYPAAQRLAMTATAWRTDNGLIYGKGEQFWFDELCFKYTVPQGVADGGLSPLVGVETEVQLELDEAPAGEDFNMVETSERETIEWMRAALGSAVELTLKRKHAAVYCPTVAAAMRAVVALTAMGQEAHAVHGSMNKADRRDTLEAFRAGEFKWLCSVDTLTTGWDMPALDCIVCLRPTTASNLWVQILGRGTRIADGKKNCVILDYVGNLQRLGGVDMLENYVKQSSPHEPLEAVPAPPREPRKIYPGVRTLAVLDPTSGEQARSGAELRVQVHNVNAVAMNTRRNPAQPSLMVTYACTTVEGARIDATAFIETEGTSAEAQHFFNQRRLAVTLPIEARKVQWMMKGAAQPRYITVVKRGKYWNVTSEVFQPKELT